jgi:hypothetical protein
MKWTDEINVFIVRSYYGITEMEIDLKTYRNQLYGEFIENVTTESRLQVLLVLSVTPRNCMTV